MASGNGDTPNAAALFEAANKLRGSVESAEYKHLVLGLLFLKYISDSFELRRARARARAVPTPPATATSADAAERAEVLDDRDEYIGDNVFWVPRRAGRGCSPPLRSPTSPSGSMTRWS